MQTLKKFKILSKILMTLILILGFTSCVPSDLGREEIVSIESSHDTSNQNLAKSPIENIKEDKAYYKIEDVAAYIHFYNRLPKNYLTKKEAKALGWIPRERNLWDVTDKGVIGGDHFGNFEKTLPEGSYKEADVNYDGGSRGPERLVYDENGNIFYTKDHYKNFERIY